MSYYNPEIDEDTEIIIPIGPLLPVLATTSIALIMFWFTLRNLSPSLNSSVSFVSPTSGSIVDEYTTTLQLSNDSGEKETVTPSSPDTEHEGTSADVLAECVVSRKYPEKITRWCNLISLYATKRNLDPDFVAAVILQESGGNAKAYSSSGAVGLMQIMPRDGLAASFMCSAGPCFANRPRIAQLEDPEFNIDFGTRMLANLKKRHGNLRDALKAYGPMDVGYYYADKVLGLYRSYAEK